MPKRAPTVKIRELRSAELESIYPLLKQLNPTLTRAMFTARLKAMEPLGYRVAAAFEGKRMVALSGFWIRTRFWCGRELDIDNFITDPACRGEGVGAKLVAWLEKKALAEKCDLIVLDVYASNPLAHRFYHRHGFTITGYHMTKMPGSSVPLAKCAVEKTP